MSRKFTAEEKAEALEKLRQLLPAGSTITTVSRHSTQATSWISPLIVHDGDIYDLSYLVARAGIFKMDRNHEGVKSGGYGLSRSYQVVYNLSRAVFPDGVLCTGPGCNSNDHTNGDRDYSQRGIKVHSDGGYALNHRSL